MRVQVLGYVCLVIMAAVLPQSWGAELAVKDRDRVRFSIAKIFNRTADSQVIRFQFGLCTKKKGEGTQAPRCFSLTSLTHQYTVRGKPFDGEEYESRPDYISPDIIGTRVNQAAASGLAFFSIAPADAEFYFFVGFGESKAGESNLTNILGSARVAVPDMAQEITAPIEVNVKGSGTPPLLESIVNIVIDRARP